jgi:AcrR family transcriptional regulator
MPAHPKTTDAQIVQVARDLVDRMGRDGFSMNDVAAAVGIRAPSLYGRFKDRASLIAAVELQAWAELTALLGAAIVPDDPKATIIAQARAVRRFAAGHPNCYALFSNIGSAPTEDGDTALAAAIDQMVTPLTALVGAERAFAAERVIVPFLHGFISMELANSFRLGDGVSAAFENGLAVILRGLVQPDAVDAEA